MPLLLDFDHPANIYTLKDIDDQLNRMFDSIKKNCEMAIQKGYISRWVNNNQTYKRNMLPNYFQFQTPVNWFQLFRISQFYV